MKSQDLILIGFTFVTGVAVGVYLYVTAFMPTYNIEKVPVIGSNETAFNVVGKAYGGHTISGYVQPSFEISANGHYEYFAGGVDADTAVPKEGKLDPVLFADLKSVIRNTDLATYGEATEKEFCTNFADGTDYIYRITLEGKTYELDSCRTVFPYESDLAHVLSDVWADIQGFDVHEPLPPTKDSSSPALWFEHWLQGYFDYNATSSVPNEADHGTGSAPGYGDDREPVACTMDAKICPDGSAVGRVPPSCEFARCPGE